MCTTREAGAGPKAPAAGPKDPRQHFKLQAAQERAERLQSQPEELERQRAALLMQEQALAQQEATIATLVPRTAEGAERAGRAAAGGSGGEVREEEEEGAQSTDKDQGLDDYDGEDAVSTDEDQEEEQADDGSGCTSETTVTPAKRRRNRSAHGGKAPGKGRKYCPNPACRKVVGSPTRTCPYCKSPCTTTTSKKKKAAQPSSAAKAADLTNGAAPPMSMSMAMAMAPIVLAVQRRVAIPASAAAVAAGTTHVFVNTRQAKAILRRREQREKQNARYAPRQPFLHKSRHKHASGRTRGPDGKFLSGAEPMSLAAPEVETAADNVGGGATGAPGGDTA